MWAGPVLTRAYSILSCHAQFQSLNGKKYFQGSQQFLSQHTLPILPLADLLHRCGDESSQTLSSTLPPNKRIETDIETSRDSPRVHSALNESFEASTSWAPAVHATCIVLLSSVFSVQWTAAGKAWLMRASESGTELARTIVSKMSSATWGIGNGIVQPMQRVTLPNGLQTHTQAPHMQCTSCTSSDTWWQAGGTWFSLLNLGVGEAFPSYIRWHHKMLLPTACNPSGILSSDACSMLTRVGTSLCCTGWIQPSFCDSTLKRSWARLTMRGSASKWHVRQWVKWL